MAKNILLILIFVTVVVVLLWGWPGFLNKKTTNSNQVSTTTNQTNNSKNQNKNQSVAPTNKSSISVASQSVSYTDAMNTYGASGRRIQFDQNCFANPTKINIKKGTYIMLDNRSDQVRPIYLDNAKYTLDAYSFKIVKITTTAPLPHTMRVDCGTGKNNAQIVIQ